MPWRDDAEEVLPPRRSREPANLRNDILDELADHLALAAERERQAGVEDENTVWRRVVERFGDPNRVARQLWWDAMREQIMREWIHTGVVVVGVAVVIVCAVFGFRLIQATNQTLQALLAQQKTQEVTLATFKVKVRRGSASGPPVTGQKVRLVGQPFRDSDQTISETLNASGEAVFGPFRPGDYCFGVSDTETGLQTDMMSVTLYAGEREEQIVVPENRPVRVELRAKMPPPSDDNHQLVRAEVTWSMEYSGRLWKPLHPHSLLLGADGMWEYELIGPPQRVKADALGRTLGDDYMVLRRAENPLDLEVVAQDISVQVSGRVLTSGLPGSDPRDYLARLPNPPFPFVAASYVSGWTTDFHLNGQSTFEVPLDPLLEQALALEPRVCRLLECGSPPEPRLAIALATLFENFSCPEVFPVPEAGQGWISGNLVKGGVCPGEGFYVTPSPFETSSISLGCGVLSVPEQLRNGLVSSGKQCLLALYDTQERNDTAPAPMVFPLKAPWNAFRKSEDRAHVANLTEGYDIDATAAVRPMATLPYYYSGWYVFDLTDLLSTTGSGNSIETLAVAMESTDKGGGYRFVSTQLQALAIGGLDGSANLRPAFYVFSEPATQPEPAAQ